MKGVAEAREVPSAIYFDLATWHLINTAYVSARVAQLRRMRSYYEDARHHEWLMTVLQHRLGHQLAGAVERAKIEVAHSGTSRIDPGTVEPGLSVDLALAQVLAAIEFDLDAIVEAALRTVALCGLASDRIDAVYFTGGSTGLQVLRARILAALPRARGVTGDPFASVARGLGLHAAQS